MKTSFDRARRPRPSALPVITAAGLLAYVACTPDFAALQEGKGTASGGRASGGTASLGGRPSGGSPECPEADCSGGTTAAGGHVESGGSENPPAGGAAGSSPLQGGAGGVGGVATLGGAAGEPSGGAPVSHGTAGQGGEGGGEPVSPPPRCDFETSLCGFQPVGDERPPDVLDHVGLSTGVAHHGTRALEMDFNGTSTPLASGASSFYGVYTPVGPPPRNAAVTFWMMSTVDNVSAQVYVQLKPDYAWQVISVAALSAGVWQEVDVQIPDMDLFTFGIQINSALDINGSIYLDEVRW